MNVARFAHHGVRLYECGVPSRGHQPRSQVGIGVIAATNGLAMMFPANEIEFAERDRKLVVGEIDLYGLPSFAWSPRLDATRRLFQLSYCAFKPKGLKDLASFFDDGKFPSG